MIAGKIQPTPTQADQIGASYVSPQPSALSPVAACFLALLSLCSAARADLITNGSFETVTPALGANGICETAGSPAPYSTCSATGWTGNYQVGRGSTTGVGGSSFNIPQPDPDGVNALILQQVSSASQSVNVLAGGLYTLTFYTANRTTAGLNGNQTLEVLFNGSLIAGGTLTNIPGSWTQETFTFNANPGTEALTFLGLGAGSADVTAFIDNVSLNPASTQSITPEPNSLLLLGTGILAVSSALRRRLS